MATKSVSKSQSLVWKFFSVKHADDETAVCHMCKRDVKRGQKSKGPKSYSTTPLHNHLKRWNKSEYDSAYSEFSKKKVEADSLQLTPKERKLKEMSSSQTTLEGSFKAAKIWDINDSRSQAISNKIVKMMASDNQPFSIVEDQGFIELLAHLEHRYLIPSRKYFTQEALPKLYDNVRPSIANELGKAKFILITSDPWTCSHSNESFISLTGHWLDGSFHSKSAMLNARHFPGKHTGALIEAAFHLMLEEWSIEPCRIQMLVHDGASNIALSSRLAELDSVHCFIHRLQLCIEDSIFSQRTVNDTCAKARRIVTHFQHSSQACTSFKNIQLENGSKNPLLLVQDVKTRWNSTFLMLQRLSVLITAVQLYAADHEIPVPTPIEWQLMDKKLRLLQPFFEITKKVSGEQSLLSSVIPDVAALNRYLNKCNVKATGVYTLKDELQNALKKRFLAPQHEDKLNIMFDKPFVLSTFLDSRFKGRYMQHESFAEG